MPLTFQQTNALEILVHRLGQLDDQDDKLDKKAQDNIQAISIIFAFVSAFKLLESLADGANLLLFVAVFLVYAASVSLSYYVLLPKRWMSPLETIPAQIQAVTQWPENMYFRQLTLAYSKAIIANEAVVRLKARVVWWATVLIFVDIVLIIVLAAR